MFVPIPVPEKYFGGLLTWVKDILGIFNDFDAKRKEHNKKLGEAVGGIQTAVRSTKAFIQSHGLIPSDEIARHWQEAFDKVIEADGGTNLASMLHLKVSYWGDPAGFLSNPDKEALPSLDHLEAQCAALVQKLKMLE